MPPIAGRRGARAEAAAALALQGFGASGSHKESGRAELFPGELGLPGHREGLHLQGQHGSLGYLGTALGASWRRVCGCR